MKKLLLIILFLPVFAKAQTWQPLPVSFYGNIPGVNSQDSVKATYPGRVGGPFYLYPAEYIRKHFGSGADSTVFVNKTFFNSVIGTAALARINTKQVTLVSGTNIKSLNGVTLLGSGNINTVSTNATTGGAMIVYTGDLQAIAATSVAMTSASATNSLLPAASSGMLLTGYFGATNINQMQWSRNGASFAIAANNGGTWTSPLIYTGTPGSTYTFPTTTQTIAGLTATQVFTNKDLTSGTNTFPTFNQNTTGSAAKWTTGRTLSITGDIAYTSPAIDGSGNVTAAATLPTVNSNVGSFTNANITVNAKGQITASANGTATATGANPTAIAGKTAINGSATTFMRSDAAPAIDTTAFVTVSGVNSKISPYFPRLSTNNTFTGINNFSNSIKAPFYISTTTAAGTAGTDSLLVKNATTNVIGKISPTYYAQAPIKGNSTTTGTATTAVTVTIGSTMANTSYNVTITPRDLLTAVNYYISAQTTTAFTVTFVTGLTGSINFDYNINP